MALEFRLCDNNEDYRQVAQLEIQVWGVGELETLAIHTMHVITHTGGFILGAFYGTRLIGCSVGFAMQASGQLWSHVTAVHPDYQGQGIGYQLKHRQRELALAKGYTQMRWSFDPAMRQNANFNCHLLGVEINRYHPNFYGVMKDGINKGVPSDRFEAIWQLDSEGTSHDIPDDAPFLLLARDRHPEIIAQATDSYHRVVIPYDFLALKADNLDIALQWRYAMREVLQAAFEQGYRVVDFATDKDARRCWYVLWQVRGDR